MGVFILPALFFLAAVVIFVLLIFTIANRIDSKRKEKFEKRDY